MSATSVRRRRAIPPRRSATHVDGDAAEVVRCLRRLFRALQEYSKKTQRRFGLSSPQLWALNLLDAEPGLSLTDLAEKMFSHPSTVSGVVDRLVERGAVSRQVPREDRRGVRLSLTPAGQALVRSAPSPVQQGLSGALARFSPARLRQLRRALEDIVKHAELDRVEAPFFDGDPGTPARTSPAMGQGAGRLARPGTPW